MLATKRGHRSVVLTLLKYGASMDITDNRHRTPLEIARKRKHRHVEECLDGNVQHMLERRRAREQALRYYVLVIKRLDGEGKSGRLRVSDDNNLVVKLTSELPTSVVYHVLSFVSLPNAWGSRVKQCGMMLNRVEDMINGRSPVAQKTMDGLLGKYFTLCEDIIDGEVDLADALEGGGVEAPTGFHSWTAWNQCRRQFKKWESERVCGVILGSKDGEDGDGGGEVIMEEAPSLKRGGFSGSTTSSRAAAGSDGFDPR